MSTPKTTLSTTNSYVVNFRPTDDRTYKGQRALLLAFFRGLGGVGAWAGIFFSSVATTSDPSKYAYWSFSLLGFGLIMFFTALATITSKIVVKPEDRSLQLQSFWGAVIEEVAFDDIEDLQPIRYCGHDGIQLTRSDDHLTALKAKHPCLRMFRKKHVNVRVRDLEQFQTDFGMMDDNDGQV